MCQVNINCSLPTFMANSYWSELDIVPRLNHRTDCWIEWTILTSNYMDKTVVGPDWFDYCIIVLTIESISVACNYYFVC